MKVLWSILCGGISIDRETNNISLFNVIEQIKPGAVFEVPEAAEAPPEAIDNPPQVISSLSMRSVTLWARTNLDTPETGQGRHKLVPPTGEPSVSNPYKIDLTKFKRTRVITNFPGLPSRGPGQYVVVVELEQAKGEWATLFELPIEVDVQEGSDAEP